MNRDREYERLQRMYKHLDEEYADLQKKYDELLDENNQPLEEVIALMANLREIKDEWTLVLNELNGYRDKYHKLITEMKEALSKMKKGKL